MTSADDLPRDEEPLRCPRCARTLVAPPLDGSNRCVACGGAFDAVVLAAEVLPLLVVDASPGDVTCAAHAGNRAVAECTRCGAFACGLCAVAEGEGWLCPACFFRLREEADVVPRDFIGLARKEAAAALLLCCGPVALLTVYHGWKGMAQARREDRPLHHALVPLVIGVVVALIWVWQMMVVLTAAFAPSGAR